MKVHVTVSISPESKKIADKTIPNLSAWFEEKIRESAGSVEIRDEALSPQEKDFLRKATSDKSMCDAFNNIFGNSYPLKFFRRLVQDHKDYQGPRFQRIDRDGTIEWKEVNEA